MSLSVMSVVRNSKATGRSPCRFHMSLKQSLCRSWGFQEVQAPRFQDNRHTKVVRSALSTGCLVLISISDWVHPRVIGLCQWKITMRPSGIERSASTNCVTACPLSHVSPAVIIYPAMWTLFSLHSFNHCVRSDFDSNNYFTTYRSGKRFGLGNTSHKSCRITQKFIVVRVAWYIGTNFSEDPATSIFMCLSAKPSSEYQLWVFVVIFSGNMINLIDIVTQWLIPNLFLVNFNIVHFPCIYALGKASSVV